MDKSEIPYKKLSTDKRNYFKDSASISLDDPLEVYSEVCLSSKLTSQFHVEERCSSSSSSYSYRRYTIGIIFFLCFAALLTHFYTENRNVLRRSNEASFPFNFDSKKLSRDLFQIHQIQIDEALAEELLDEDNSTTLPITREHPELMTQIRKAYKSCKRFDSQRNPAKKLNAIIHPIMKTFDFRSQLFEKRQEFFGKTSAFSSKSFAEMLARLDTTFGSQSLFEWSVQASDDSKKPFAIHLRSTVHRWRINEATFDWILASLHTDSNNPESPQEWERILEVKTALEQIVKLVTRIQSECSQESGFEYVQRTMNQLDSEWISTFHFSTYFSTLADSFGAELPAELREKLSNRNLQVILQNPVCFKAVDRHFNAFKSTQNAEKKQNIADLIHYILLAEKSTFLDASAANEANHESIESVDNHDVERYPLRLECVAELRRTVPYLMGRVYAEYLNKKRTDVPVKELKADFINFYRSLIRAFIARVQQMPGFQKYLAVEKLQNLGVTYGLASWILHDNRKFDAIHKELKSLNPNPNEYLTTRIRLNRFAMKQKLLKLIDDDEYERDRPFEKICSASVEIEYSRAGNWLQVPLAILTLPELQISLKNAAVNLEKYSMVGRELSAQVAKSIDSLGSFWFSNGYFRSRQIYGPNFQLTAFARCLKSKFKLSFDSVRLNRITHELIGIRVSFDQFQEELLNKKTFSKLAADKKSALIKQFLDDQTQLLRDRSGAEQHKRILDDFLGNLFASKQEASDACSLRFDPYVPEAEENYSELPDVENNNNLDY